MANHVSHAALPYPVKGCRFTIEVPYLDADGDPTDPTTPDTERSIDAAAFADCTEEVSTVTGSNGFGYITLTGDEMNGSLILVAAKVASGPKNTLASLHPRVLPILRSGTAQAGAAGTITLDSSASAIDDFYNGCIVRTTGGTGGGGGSGSLGNQARVITDYVGSTKVASVAPDWETNPSSDTTFEVLLTELAWFRVANTVQISGTAQTARDLGASVLLSSGTGTGQLDFTSGVVKADAVKLGGTTQTGRDVGADTASIQADTDDIQTRLPAALVSGRMDSSVGAMAAGVVTAAAVATGAIDADAVAADAVAEIADGVWDEAISGHLGAGSTGAALNAAGSAGDPWSTPLPGAYGAGTAGKIIGDNIDAAVSSRAAVSDIPTAVENADALLKRDMAAVTGEAARSMLNALRFLRNKWTVTGNALSVKKEDDTTEAWNATVTTDPTAQPIIGNDPS